MEEASARLITDVIKGSAHERSHKSDRANRGKRRKEDPVKEISLNDVNDYALKRTDEAVAVLEAAGFNVEDFRADGTTGTIRLRFIKRLRGYPEAIFELAEPDSSVADGNRPPDGE